MEYRLRSDEWAKITPSERIYRCYLMAEEAALLSQKAPPQLAQAYRDLVDQFHKVAKEIVASEMRPS